MEVTPPKIVEEGEFPVYKTSPNMRKNVMLGFLVGAVLIAGIVIALELLDDTVKNEDDIERYLEIPTLAVVPDVSADKKNRKKKQREKKK